MKYVVRRILAAVVSTSLALLAACNVDTVSIDSGSLGAIVKVRAFVLVDKAELNPVSLPRDQTIKLNMYQYGTRDSAQNVFVPSWVSRNPGIVTTSGLFATTVGVGTVYVVGQIEDNGRVFSDSVRITVTTP